LKKATDWKRIILLNFHWMPSCSRKPPQETARFSRGWFLFRKRVCILTHFRRLYTWLAHPSCMGWVIYNDFLSFISLKGFPNRNFEV
jgi:hypothetical protein